MTSRRNFVSSLIIASTLAILPLTNSGAATPPANPSDATPIKIAIVGDSISSTRSGLGLVSWPKQLQYLFSELGGQPVVVRNFSVPGETYWSALNVANYGTLTQMQMVTNWQPHYVITMMGFNDRGNTSSVSHGQAFTAALPAPEIRLEQLLMAWDGVNNVLLTTRGVTQDQALRVYNTYPQLQTPWRSHQVDFWRLDQMSFLYDYIHPDDEGCTMIADDVYYFIYQNRVAINLQKLPPQIVTINTVFNEWYGNGPLKSGWARAFKRTDW